MYGIGVLALVALLAACERAPTELVADLSLGGEVADAARQELLLAKERAVGPLLAALEQHDLPRRIAVAEVLVSLMLRVDDEQLMERLQHHLRRDSDADVRALLARRLGAKFHAATIDSLIAALDDDSGEVRYGAWLSLGALQAHQTPAHTQQLRARAPKLATDPHEKARSEALIQVERFLEDWLARGQQSALEAQVAEAESLFTLALDYFPDSQRAAVALARLYYDNDRRDESLRVLAGAKMLLHARRLPQAPVIDGVLERVWQQAATSSRFFAFSYAHSAALPTDTRTQFHVGYTDSALFVGITAWDDDPDSLIVRATGDDDQTLDSWKEDRLEMFFAPDAWQRPVLQISVNSAGHLFHSIYTTTEWSWAWDPPGATAATVGADGWTAEYELVFNRPEVPIPRSGDMWGFNVARAFRGSEFSQWTRTQNGSASTRDYGILLFE